jgi:hypothetical protein
MQDQNINFQISCRLKKFDAGIFKAERVKESETLCVMKKDQCENIAVA